MLSSAVTAEQATSLASGSEAGSRKTSISAAASTGPVPISVTIATNRARNIERRSGGCRLVAGTDRQFIVGRDRRPGQARSSRCPDRWSKSLQAYGFIHELV